MMKSNRPQLLYQTIICLFCVIVVMSNIISAKMVTLPDVFGFSIPAGLLTYPLTFMLSDLVTEIYGVRHAKNMVYLALAMTVLSYGLIYFALVLPASSVLEGNAFELVLGLSGVRIIASLTAYAVSQTLDIRLFAWIKTWTGPQHLWLRNNASTWASQIVDTILVDTIYLYFGLNMGIMAILPIMLFSCTYKSVFTLAATPLFYLSVSVTNIFLLRNRVTT